LNSRYFSAEIIGRVNGAQAPVALPLTLVGIPLSGYVFDQTGSYTLVINACLPLLLIAFAVLLMLPQVAPGR